MSIPDAMLNVIASWLRARSARVVIGGQQSESIAMQDMVYQGTVFGPPLWNCFFADSCFATRALGFQEVVYADDLNAWNSIAADISDAQAFQSLRECQSSLHAWGRANRVRFDVEKEHFHILSHTRPAGENFKILGVVFDPKLLMHEAVESCVAACSWKLYTLVRTKRYYTDAELLGLFKAHILSYIEYRTSAISHASSSTLAPLDFLLTRFLRS